MKQLLLYFIAFILLDIILIIEGNINFILSTIVLSILFYVSLRKEVNTFLTNFKHYLKGKNEKSTKI
jgi:hypothetical protein